MKFLQVSDLFVNNKGRQEEFILLLEEKQYQVDHVFFIGNFRSQCSVCEETSEEAQEIVEYVLEISKCVGVTESKGIHFIAGSEDLLSSEAATACSLSFFEKITKALYGIGIRDFGNGYYALTNKQWVELDDVCFVYIDGNFPQNPSDAAKAMLDAGRKMQQIALEVEKSQKPVVVLARQDFWEYSFEDRLLMKSIFEGFSNMVYLSGSSAVAHSLRNASLELDGTIVAGESVCNLGWITENDGEFSVLCRNETIQSSESTSDFQFKNPLTYLPRTRELTVNAVIFQQGEFLGRKPEIEAIYEAFKENQLVLLHSLVGGMGKSELARALYHQLKESDGLVFDEIAWIRFDDTLLKSFWNKFKGISSSMPSEYLKEVGKLLDKKKTLLVLDNANEISPEDILYLSQLKCHVLLTSRVVKTGVHTVTLGSLSSDDCRLLYCSQLSCSEEMKKNLINSSKFKDDIGNICSSVGNLTLAVKILARIQDAKNITVSQMSTHLDEKGIDFSQLVERVKLTYSEMDALQDISEGTMNQLMAQLFNLSSLKHQKESLQILVYFAMLQQNSELSFKYLKKWFSLNNLDTLNQLHENNWLIRRSTTSDVYFSIHPIIGEMIRNQNILVLDNTELGDFIKRIADDLDYSQNKSLTERFHVLPHAECLLTYACVNNLKNDENYKKYSCLLANVARNLNEYMRGGKEYDYIMEAITVDEAHQDSSLSELARDYRYKGNVHFYRRQPNEFEDLDQAIIDFRIAFVFGRRAIEDIFFRYGTALPESIPHQMITLDQDDLYKQLEEQVVYIKELYQRASDSMIFSKTKALWIDFSATLNSYGNVLNNRKITNDIKGAEILFELTAKILLHIKGNEDLQLALVYNNLASIHKENQNYKEAENANLSSFTIRYHHIERNKELVAYSLHTRALLFRDLILNDNGDTSYLVDVIFCLRMTCILRKEVYGGNHREIASAYSDLANIFEMKLDYRSSYECYLRSYTINLTLWGKHHSYTKTALSNKKRLVELLREHNRI